jgi:hypothetical protein
MYQGFAAVSLPMKAANHLIARDASGAEVRVDFAEIEQIERRDLAPGKTAGLVVGLVVLGYGIAVAEAYGEILRGL